MLKTTPDAGSARIAKYESGRHLNPKWRYLFNNHDRYPVTFSDNGDAVIDATTQAELDRLALKNRLEKAATHRPSRITGLHSAHRHLGANGDVNAIFRGGRRSVAMVTNSVVFPENRDINIVLVVLEKVTVSFGQRVTWNLGKDDAVFVSAMDPLTVNVVGAVAVYTAIDHISQVSDESL